jgi:hypothetical protein
MARSKRVEIRLGAPESSFKGELLDYLIQYAQKTQQTPPQAVLETLIVYWSPLMIKETKNSNYDLEEFGGRAVMLLANQIRLIIESLELNLDWQLSSRGRLTSNPSNYPQVCLPNYVDEIEEEAILKGQEFSELGL